MDRLQLVLGESKAGESEQAGTPRAALWTPGTTAQEVTQACLWLQYLACIFTLPGTSLLLLLALKVEAVEDPEVELGLLTTLMRRRKSAEWNL